MKIYTVNRRLSGSVEIEEHDFKHKEVLEKARIEEGVVSFIKLFIYTYTSQVHKLISKVAMFSQECYSICTVNRGKCTNISHVQYPI